MSFSCRLILGTMSCSSKEEGSKKPGYSLTFTARGVFFISFMSDPLNMTHQQISSRIQLLLLLQDKLKCLLFDLIFPRAARQ